MRSEFEFIQHIKSKYSLSRIGDDCAVIPKDAKTDLLLTADMLIEDIDFRLDWTTPEFLGHKSLAVSLSDIAAMGGQPTWSMLSIGVPDNLWNSNFVDRFYEAWFALAQAFDVELVGGDISKTDGKLVIDSTVGGEVAKGNAILRSTATVGDVIFVTGDLGGAAGGLNLLESGRRMPDLSDHREINLALKQLQPQPQLEIAKHLQIMNIATSMIDISDGLSSDLGHICRSSWVGARIVEKNVPCNRDLEGRFTREQILQMAFHGGEDFELLFTVSEKNISQLTSLDISRIGEITANVGSIELITPDDTSILEPKGYRHF